MVLHLLILLLEKTALVFFAEDDIDLLVTKMCKNYPGINRRHNSKHLLSSYEILQHDFTDAYEIHKILKLNDVHLNLRQNN